MLSNVPLGPLVLPSPELGAVYVWRDRYYALVCLDDLEPQVNNDFTDFRPGQTTFVADSPSGPFSPAPRNRRLLVGNSSFFTRFVDTPEGVLVNYQSWEIRHGSMLNVAKGTTCMAPLKRAVWDDEGTLRLKWWEKNETAKARHVDVKSRLLDTDFDPEKTVILEGEMLLSASPVGLFVQGAGNHGTAFLVHKSGLVEYGDMDRDGARFEKKGYVDRDLFFEDVAHFRLIRKGRITEFFLNDYLMQCYCLPELGTGRLDLIGSSERFGNFKGWYCS